MNRSSRTSLANRRMVAGGRLWSESPIRRSVSRVRSTGEEGITEEPIGIPAEFIGYMAYTYAPPAYSFPQPEIIYSGTYYTPFTVIHTVATWNGAAVAHPGTSGGWVTLPGTTGYTLEISPGVGAGDFRYWSSFRITVGTDKTLRVYTTLPDTAGTGTPANTLLKMTKTPTNYYLPRSSDPGSPSFALTQAQSLAAYNFTPPVSLTPPSGRTAVSGTLRISAEPLADSNTYWAEVTGTPIFQPQIGGPSDKKVPVLTYGTALQGITTTTGWSLNLTRLASDAGLSTVRIFQYPATTPPVGLANNSDPSAFNASGSSYYFTVPVADLPLGTSVNIPVPPALMARFQSGADHSLRFDGVNASSGLVGATISGWSFIPPA